MGGLCALKGARGRFAGSFGDAATQRYHACVLEHVLLVATGQQRLELRALDRLAVEQDLRDPRQRVAAFEQDVLGPLVGVVDSSSMSSPRFSLTRNAVKVGSGGGRPALGW